MMRRLLMIISWCWMLWMPGTLLAANCRITLNGSFAFGTYDPFSSTPVNITAPNFIAVACQGRGFATIDLSTGSSGGYYPRTMRNGIDSLNYNLYTNANLTSVWGDGTGGTVNVRFRFRRNTAVAYSLYGQIPAQQNVTAGSYIDSIIITVSF
ncbi:MAG: spore coat protein U domain-containing protein [Gammaproteobacteria bacterium]|nr:spore coat protein U domain-containing protein [Gammaproteobacteria bacterium]